MRWLTSPRTTGALVLAAGLLPLMALGVAAGLGRLGVNPIETVVRDLGDWALRLLLITLALTPLRRATRWPGWTRHRRLIGLLAFFYATLHLLVYGVLDQFFWGFQWSYLARDVFKRPFMLAGVAAFLLLVPLAVTSTRGWRKRLRRHWKTLHRLIYPAAVLAVVHYFMMLKGHKTVAVVHGGILVLLLLARVRWRRS